MGSQDDWYRRLGEQQVLGDLEQCSWLVLYMGGEQLTTLLRSANQVFNSIGTGSGQTIGADRSG